MSSPSTARFLGQEEGHAIRLVRVEQPWLQGADIGKSGEIETR
jgi:hypothetical protein